MITPSYHSKLSQRIEASRVKIVQSSNMVSSGRVVPENTDLVIGSGRRLEAVVLFLDICSFSTRAAESAEEQDLVLRVLNLFLTEMIRIVEDFGGCVEKNTGDGIMAYFANEGAKSGTDVRQTATSAAISMFYACEHFINPILLATPTEPVSFRVCLDFGWITIARMGAAKRFNSLAAVGGTANRTCKMLSKASQGSLWVGDNMLPGLPKTWAGFFLGLYQDTTWVYRNTGHPYRFWAYSGRWKVPNV